MSGFMQTPTQRGCGQNNQLSQRLSGGLILDLSQVKYV